ncbi:thioredoxin family protein [Archangium sp.]|jgi:thiol:disulfide interchange protein|uniref:thioredoxin family protein n=1 Tax=Archangium sp. TaxID=1872627 RepID=UPI003899F4CF
MRPAESGSTRALPRWLVVAVPLLLGARVASGFYEKAHPSIPSGLVAWVPLEQAEALSRERNLPILYDFSADWCMPCQMLDRDVFNEDKAARYINASYIPVRVTDRTNEDGENVPAVKALIEKYKVLGFPAVITVSPDGRNVRQKRGYDGYTDTMHFLRLPTPSGRRAPPLSRPGSR